MAEHKSRVENLWFPPQCPSGALKNGVQYEPPVAGLSHSLRRSFALRFRYFRRLRLSRVSHLSRRSPCRLACAKLVLGQNAIPVQITPLKALFRPSPSSQTRCAEFIEGHQFRLPNKIRDGGHYTRYSKGSERRKRTSLNTAIRLPLHGRGTTAAVHPSLLFPLTALLWVA